MSETNCKPRDYRYELVRVLAIFCVVGLHCTAFYRNDGSFLSEFSFNLISDIFFTSNGLFFILSGKFALKHAVPDDEYGDFYFKKFIYLILPVLIYMVFFSVFKHWYFTGSLAGCGTVTLLNVLSGYCQNTHLWFMYVLVGCVLCSPFLSRMIEGMSRRSAIILCGLCFGYNFLFAYTPLFIEGTLLWGNPFGQWVAYFILGGCIDKVFITEKQRNYAIFAGILGLCIISLKHYFFSYKMFIHDLMPSYTATVVMMYFLLLKLRVSSERAQSFVLFMGKRTFGIYLVHFFLINPIESSISFLSRYTGAGFLYLALIIMVVFLASLLLSYAFEFLVVSRVQQLCVSLRNLVSQEK